MEVKSGWKSTEFWLTLAGNVAALLTTVSGIIEPQTGGWMLAICNGLYAISRGIAKVG
jgi:uncharacterized membrane protein HdeD (DUF308 family)